VRHGDTVGRTGGDEILVVLPGLSGLDQLLEISETIRAQAAEPIVENGERIRATLSIGATLAIPGETVTAVMARADAAMYQAKAGDRNTVVLMEPEESF
jgi:diguanylate cyclase (GGDEF)-like protein